VLANKYHNNFLTLPDIDSTPSDAYLIISQKLSIAANPTQKHPRAALAHEQR